MRTSKIPPNSTHRTPESGEWAGWRLLYAYAPGSPLKEFDVEKCRSCSFLSALNAHKIRHERCNFIAKCLNTAIRMPSQRNQLRCFCRAAEQLLQKVVCKRKDANICQMCNHALARITGSLGDVAVKAELYVSASIRARQIATQRQQARCANADV